MPIYIYTVKDKKGNLIKKTQEASSREEIIASAKNKGLFITSIEELSGTRILGKRKYKIKKHIGIKKRDLIFFVRNLSAALSAGVPLLRSLGVIGVQTESYNLELLIRKIMKDIRAGLSLSESIKKYSRFFSPLWVGLIEVGEASGNLPYILDRLADYIEIRHNFEQKIKTSLIYPGLILSIGLLVAIGFMKFILPLFMKFMEGLDTPLPTLTLMVFNIGRFVNEHFFIVIGGLVVLGIFLFNFFTKKNFAPIRERFLIKTPLLSGFFNMISLERFTSTMHILLESGVPIVYALDIAANSAGYIVKNMINIVKQKVKEGESLSSEMDKSGFFPPLLIEMVRMGEETGNLSEMFSRISEYYRKELTVKIERVTLLIEPVIIMVVGGIIVFLVITLYLPIFNISNVRIKM